MVNEKAAEGDYVTSWAEFRFLPNALEGLVELAALGVPVVIVSNQRGIARGRMTAAAVDDIHARMTEAVRAAGGRIDGVYVCPHEGGCDCRKPGTGMFLQAGRELGFDPAGAAVVGDRGSDMEAARRLGATAVFITGFPEDPGPVDLEAGDLLEAAQMIRRTASTKRSLP